MTRNERLMALCLPGFWAVAWWAAAAAVGQAWRATMMTNGRYDYVAGRKRRRKYCLIERERLWDVNGGRKNKLGKNDERCVSDIGEQ